MIAISLNLTPKMMVILYGKITSSWACSYEMRSFTIIHPDNLKPLNTQLLLADLC